MLIAIIPSISISLIFLKPGVSDKVVINLKAVEDYQIKTRIKDNTEPKYRLPEGF
jgi:hypothetical protein